MQREWDNSVTICGCSRSELISSLTCQYVWNITHFQYLSIYCLWIFYTVYPLLVLNCSTLIDKFLHCLNRMFSDDLHIYSPKNICLNFNCTHRVCCQHLCSYLCCQRNSLDIKLLIFSKWRQYKTTANKGDISTHNFGNTKRTIFHQAGILNYFSIASIFAFKNIIINAPPRTMSCSLAFPLLKRIALLKNPTSLEILGSPSI